MTANETTQGTISMKTEAEIEKEKDAVARMVGAKSAMQLMIDRHTTLVSALEFVNTLIEDMAKSVGEDLYIRTFHHGERNKDGAQCVQVKAQLKRITDRVNSVVK